jgi:hypothetical protein
MTEQEEERWRELCRHAIAAKDLDKILSIWMAVNSAMQEEQREHTREPSSAQNRGERLQEN